MRSATPTSAAASHSWTIDTVPPQTTINFGPQGSTSNTSPNFGFSSSQSGSTFECRVDAAAFTACTSPHNTGTLSAGPHTFEVRATDPFDNTDPTPASRSFTVDPNGPSTSIDSGPDSVTGDSTPTFTFSSTKPNSTFECFIDGGAGFACTSPHTVSPALSDGPHTFEVQATDSSGNTDPAPASATFTVDTTAPDTTIDSAPDALTNDNDATFTFSSDDSRRHLRVLARRCRLRVLLLTASTRMTSTTARTPSGSAPLDQVGNADQTPAEATFEVDTTAPSTTIDSGPSGLTNDSTPSFEFSSEAGATFECRVDSDPFASCTSPHETTALSDGTHTFEVQATDDAGNTEASPQSQSFTVDTTPPDTAIDSVDVTGDDATVTFSSPATTTRPSSARSTAAPSRPAPRPRTYDDLTVGDHTVEVRATDAASNTDPSPASQTFTVNPPPDTTAPQTTIDSGTVNDDDATFTFSSSEPGSTFTCQMDTGAAEACTSPKTYNDLAVGAHTFTVFATDAAGNPDTTPASRTVTVEEDDDPGPLPGRCANIKNGTSAGETLMGTNFGDLIRGGGGADRIVGLASQDCLNGGTGNDTVLGGPGADTIRSGRGNDTVTGGPGSDQIFTDGARDRIRAKDGVRDVINCGKSKDIVTADRRDRVASNCETIRR